MGVFKIDVAIIVSACILFGCKEEYDEGFGYDSDLNKLSILTRSKHEITDESPLLTGERYMIPEESYESSWEEFTAINLGFISDKDLYAVFLLNGDFITVKTFQNIVKITNKSNDISKEVLVTLVPDPDYYRSGESMNWENFLFYGKKSDFTGYEIFADPDNGKVFGLWYCYNGKRQYGTLLREIDMCLNMKQAFLLKLAQNFSFIKVDKKKTRDAMYVEEVETIEWGDNESWHKESITIVWMAIIPEKDSQQDSDSSLSDYLTSSGGGTSKDEIDLLQKDQMKLFGNTFFKEPIISSYLVDSEFPKGGYDSSPCLSVSLALMYYGVNLTPQYIWSEVDNPDYCYSIFNDYIDPADLEMLISKHLLYYKCGSGEIMSAINVGKCCIAVSRTGLGLCTYKCMLIVGYTLDHDYIYLDPVTGLLKCRSNDFLEDYTFVIYGKT